MGEVPGDDHRSPCCCSAHPDGKVLLRSRGAPITPFDAPLKPGFHNSIEHRIYTLYTRRMTCGCSWPTRWANVPKSAAAR
jgi:two-component system OmpR family sensor kinase